MSEAEGIVVRIDASTADLEEASSLAPQIPLASTLAPGTRVSVEAIALRKGGALRRILGDKKVAVPKDARCTALLVRGYVEIAAEGGRCGGWRLGEAEAAPSGVHG